MKIWLIYSDFLDNRVYNTEDGRALPLIRLSPSVIRHFSAHSMVLNSIGVFNIGLTATGPIISSLIGSSVPHQFWTALTWPLSSRTLISQPPLFKILFCSISARLFPVKIPRNCSRWLRSFLPKFGLCGLQYLIFARFGWGCRRFQPYLLPSQFPRHCPEIGCSEWWHWI